MNITFGLRKYKKKPNILLLVDKPGWAFDISAKQIVKYLNNSFDFDIKYITYKPNLKLNKYDLIYLFFWGENYYKSFHTNRHIIIKEISSHRWEDDPRYGPCSPKEMVERYLHDASSVFCTSLRLYDTFKMIHPSVYHTPNGYNPYLFINKKQRTGRLRIGWAGNIIDPVKGYNEILIPACKNKYTIHTAPGNMTFREMSDFYNQIDVFVVGSKHEGEPLTLIEAMACGCFPVCSDVGIVPELISDRDNGIIIKNRTSENFYQAFEWCDNNLDYVRRKGDENAIKLYNERRWDICSVYFKEAFEEILHSK